ncbi:Fanconi anemia group B protein isoform X2 [Pseudorasbora parva]
MASGRLMGMLSCGGDVLAFQSKSLTTKGRDHHRKGSEVSFSRLSFDQNSRSFSIRERGLIHKDSSADADILHCGLALDEQRRQKVPCVLLKLCKKRTSAFKYMLYSAEGRLYVEFALPNEMKDHVSILQGPTLVWSHENSVFYASCRSGGVKEVSIGMTVRFIGELQRKRVIYATQHSPDVKNTLYFIEEEDEEECCDACLLPDAYSSVTQCMMVISAERIRGSFKSAILAVTSTKQLVRFEDGFPRDVCALPYEQPLSIQMVHTLKNECLVVVTFSLGNVCAVWRDTFQVACCWTGVRLMLVDDFVGCGTDQMLLVFEDQSSPGEMLGNFLLTDLCGITYSCGRSDGEVLNPSDTAQENFLLTLQALESRLQSGLNFLEDLQRDAEGKDRLTLQSLLALTDLVSGREHVIFPPEQEGLVSLWDEDEDAGEEECDVLDERMQTECAEALLKVDGVWQRVIGQSLVIGVVLKPVNNTSVMNISALIAVDCRLIGASSVIKSEILRFDPIRRSEARLTLLAVTDVAPLLTLGCCRWPIMLHYSIRDSSGSPRASLYCGRISVSLRELSLGTLHPRLLQDSTLNTDEAREDLLSLLAVLDVSSLLIRCSDHTLPDVPRWLQDSQHAERLAVDPRFTSDPADLRLFRWEQRSPFEAVLSVHCRDDLHLLQFLHSLCDFLPASHHIQLLSRSSGSARDLAQNLAPNLARALETEMLRIMQDLSSALRCGEGETTGPESDASSEPLQRLREEWQRERGRYQNRLRPLVDGPAYSTLVEMLIDTQLHADEVALKEAAHL